MTELLGQMIAVGRADGDRRRSGRALVAVMKPADLGDGDDRPGRDRLYLAPARTVGTETLVRPREVVVREVRAKHATQVTFADDDDEIEAFAVTAPRRAPQGSEPDHAEAQAPSRRAAPPEPAGVGARLP
jgi:hypothetical protein